MQSLVTASRYDLAKTQNQEHWTLQLQSGGASRMSTNLKSTATDTQPGAAMDPPTPQRRLSIDVFRGLVMFLMLAELMHLFDLAEAYPGVRLFEWLRFHTSHVEWEGCSLHDLIQPAFTFLVGVAMPFSIASRIQRGQSIRKMLLHAGIRSLILIAIGIILRSLGRENTNFTFEDTLTQIGLGYFFVFLIALAPRWVHYASSVVILVGFWLAFAIGPAPPSDFDYQAVGVPSDWPHHYDGFASRWNLNSNLSWKTDLWFMNLFPRDTPFQFNDGGYSTLSFIPTAATMLFGLIGGVWLRERTDHALTAAMLGFAALGVLSGWLLSETGLCPLVKKIWTPSFALYSGGLCMGWLWLLHWICDRKQWTWWGFPFVVIGSNSILIYVMSWTVAEPIRAMLVRHLGEAPFAVLGASFVPVLTGAVTLGILYFCLWWLHRRRAFIKI